MCGFVGIYDPFGRLSNAAEIANNMLKRISHRGPDNQTLKQFSLRGGKGTLTLAHARLAIIDLSPTANQPFQEDENILVYNGEVYNRNELIKNYRLSNFKTRSDTEVVIKMLKDYPIEIAVEKLNGMFGFAYFNQKTEKLYLTRDRFGIKPLYFAKIIDIFVFASEIRGIIASGLVSNTYDQNGIVDFLTFGHCTGISTLINSIHTLQAGHILSFNSSYDIKTKTYVNPQRLNNYSARSYKENLESFRLLLTNSVEKQLLSDVKLGVFLSGGLDSSIIAAIAKKINPDIETISLVFPEISKVDNVCSSIVASHIDSNHYEIKVSMAEFESLIEEALIAYDLPSYDGLNSYIISKVAKELGFTVCLSGLGGDEYFGGYYTFHVHQLLNKWISLIYRYPQIIRHYLYTLNNILYKISTNDKLYLLSRLLKMPNFNLSNFYYALCSIFTDEQVSMLLYDASINKEKLHPEIHLLKDVTPVTVAIAESKIFMRDQLLRDGDQMSMAHSLEVRFPFLDNEIHDFIMQLRSDYRFNSIPQKKFLFDACSDLLPSCLNERKKEGFSLPMDKWIKNYGIKKINNILAANRDPIFSFRKNAIEAIVDSYIKNKHNIRWTHLWTLVVGLSWLERNINAN